MPILPGMWVWKPHWKQGLSFPVVNLGLYIESQEEKIEKVYNQV